MGGGKLRCGVFSVVFFSTMPNGLVERSPGKLCADEAGHIGQDGLTVIEKRGENTCQ